MIDWSTQQRVTVLMPTWIGDVCMATPALQVLRDRLPPDAFVTAAVRHGMEPLLRGLSTVDEVIRVDPRGALGPWRAGRCIAQTAPDTVLIFPGSFRSALAARCSGRCRRVGYARNARRWLLTDAITPPDRRTPVSTVDWYAALIDAETTAGRPTLVITDDDRVDAAAVMPDVLRSSDPQPFVLLVPGANRADKRWPADRFATVARSLHDRFGWATVIAGAPGERALTAAVAAECDGLVVDLAAANGSLAALKAIASTAELVISNDTGPRHIALAVGTPVISLFGPTDHRWTIVPGALEHRLLAAPFLPDELAADRCAAACRIDRIVVDDVLRAVESLAAAPPVGG